MATLLGNNYRLWVESSTPGTYNMIAGQNGLSYDRKANTIDVSTKDNAPYGLTAAGLFEVSVKLDGICNLPDANGLTRVETQFKAQTATKFQIRKGGASGTGSDVVFEASCYITGLPLEYGQNDAVKYSIELGLAAAPVTDTLA